MLFRKIKTVVVYQSMSKKCFTQTRQAIARPLLNFTSLCKIYHMFALLYHQFFGIHSFCCNAFDQAHAL